MPQIWIQQLMNIVTARLDIMAYQQENTWTSQPNAGGAYFFRSDWKERFGYGRREFPAFHLYMDIPANTNNIFCGIRLEETHRNPELIVPPPVNAMFPAANRHNVIAHGKDNWMYDSYVARIQIPIGFQRDNDDQ